MPDNETNGTEENETKEGLTDKASSATDKIKDAASSNGTATKVLVPAALAAITAAAGYAAATRGGEKLKKAGLDKAEDAAQSVASEAESKGGITGMAAKALKGGGGGGSGGGLASGLASGVKSKLGGGGDKEPSTGWGSGRRNPVQRYVDVAVPVEVAYDQWTQFEEFPKFMHRVTKVEQDEEEPQKLHWEEKIWFSRRQWDAEIVEQIPHKRIVWKSVSGAAHTGRVTFHPLATGEDDGEPLTRVMATIDFTPTGMVEKMASGMRFVKRATESDLARFKAFIEAHGEPTGTWEGRIEDGEVVKDAKPKEGKPFEESGDKLKPEGAGEDKKPSKDSDGASSEGQGGDASPSDDDKDAEEREAEREERERRREERRSKQPA
jgi:uncharacterized membrane protein